MVLSTFNHIQGGNGSHWNRLMRGVNAEMVDLSFEFALNGEDEYYVGVNRAPV